MVMKTFKRIADWIRDSRGVATSLIEATATVAVGAVLAGALATQLPPGATMACLAVASTLVTLVLTPGLRAPVRVHAAQQ